VTGSVQIVNPGDGKGTSYILVVESTFDESLARGETPPGLRAPEGTDLIESGTWMIEGVPAGSYKVLGAFENDQLVRAIRRGAELQDHRLARRDLTGRPGRRRGGRQPRLLVGR
jgi:hypothetical protein